MSKATRTPELQEPVRQHLGRALAVAYATLPNFEPSDRLADLLTKLKGALRGQAHEDEREFQDAILAFTPSLIRYANSLARHSPQAEDLVQETLLKAWMNRARFRARSNLHAWLFTILRNTFFNEHRRRKREVLEGESDYADCLATVPPQAGTLDLQDVQSALRKLPGTMRDSLVLIAVQNMSYEEAAAVMGCEVGTVKSRTSRARKQLASHLGYDGCDVGADPLTLSALEWSAHRGGPDESEFGG
jgi:RNA polymerase sigma-70 factor, ECF subfamily